MENIRIWSKETKRIEAVWLGYLLTLCGWQVWKGRLIEDGFPKVRTDEEYQYVDILLFDSVDIGLCERLAVMHPSGMFCVSGDGWQQVRMRWWERCPQLTMSDGLTLLGLMDKLCNFMTRDADEHEGVLRLMSAYVAKGNALVRNMYTIHELFCSRRVNYGAYENKGLLMDAISQVESWYREYAVSVPKKAVFSEEFALTYIQNMIDDAYVKAHVTGGFDVSIIFRNANYLLKRNSGYTAVWLLKLQILRNCINYTEWPDDVLKQFISRSAPEYRGRAYCEIGDISRENPNKIFKFSPEEYFEKADDGNPEGYCGLYKLGFLYGKGGVGTFPGADEAEEKYTKVIEYINRIAPEYRTPQEFEYYYKASYGRLKLQIEKDRAYDRLSDVKMLYYEKRLNELITGIQDFGKLLFWSEFYGIDEEREQALSFMREKMGHIEELMEQLLKYEVNV